MTGPDKFSAPEALGVLDGRGSTEASRAPWRVAVTVAALVLAAWTSAFAQGRQTGSITGTVTDRDGLVIPGVTVTVTSPALQGARTATTDGNGHYTIPFLPSGEYLVRIELAGMRTIEQRQRVDLGLTATVDAQLQLDTLTEAVTVVAATPSIVTSVSTGANYRGEMVDKLASPRTIQGVAELAPGLTDNTPNAGQLTISGGFAYDNQFLIDGVDVADNLFGTANNLFIEDAIEEVQVLTSGISAEYGRFGGGVVQAITKSGSNRFAGSFRNNQYKPSWTTQTPFEKERNLRRTGDLQNIQEWTLGGPVLRDRLWFFHAGRHQSTATPQPFQQTGIANSNTAKNDRLEFKGTATAWAAQTFQGQIIRNQTEQIQPSFAFSIDPSTIVNRELPNTLVVGSWRGVLTQKLFATAQVSRRKFSFENSGGTSTNILDSPFLTRGFTSGVPATLHYNSPYFDANDPESRNNRQITGSLSYFLTTSRVGSHDIKVGYENFQTTRIGGNSQTSTNYVFQTDYLLNGSTPALDSNQKPIPVFTPALSRIQDWRATRGAELNITTQSVFAHDRWVLTPRLTFDLGVRGEFVRSEATGGIVGVDTNTWVPRLGASWDALGDGTTIVQGSYARYAGKYSEAQIGRNTAVGTPDLLTLEYRGPAGQGLNFAPGFDLSNYVVIGGSFPLETVFFDDDLRAPTTDEFTVALGRQLGDKGSVKATYQWRSMSGFIEDFLDDPTASGKVTIVKNGINFGTFDKTFWRNSDLPSRSYQAVVTQGSYRLRSNWTLDAHWTLQLENDGNFEGEGANTPGSSTFIGDYPEVYGGNWDRQNADGRLNDFQRHKVRTWTTYGLQLGRFGSVDTSAAYRFNSAQTYSLAATGQPLSAVQLARNPGYARAAGQAQTLFFDERGSESFDASHQVDLALLYQVPVWRTLRPWFKAEFYNVFNNQPLVLANTAVTPDPNSPLDANGLRTGYIRPAAFGTARSQADYPRATNSPAGTALYARTFLMSFGLRF
jgi:hypothetical protein